jgi:hypothetical protein
MQLQAVPCSRTKVRPTLKFALRAGTDADHIAHFHKMAGNRMTTIGARFAGFRDDGAEIAATCISGAPKESFIPRRDLRMMDCKCIADD